MMSTLTITNHAAIRMAQRGIQAKDAELIALIGTEVEQGYLIREKDYRQVEQRLKSFLNRFKRLVGKRLVVADGTIVTAYHTSRKHERQLLRRARESQVD